MMVETWFSLSCSFCKQRQAVHPRHVDVADDEVDVVIGLERRQRFDAVAGEQETPCAVPDLAPELLQNESLQIGLVVNDQDSGVHAAFSILVSISLRSNVKSIGLVTSASAPRSSALRLVSASP